MKQQQRPKARGKRSPAVTRKTTPVWPKRIPRELAETVGDRLKKSLRYASLSQEDMSTLLQLHRNTIGGYCTGKSRMLPVVIRVWAQETGVPESWLKTGIWPTDSA